jgi:hypothetical protein
VRLLACDSLSGADLAGLWSSKASRPRSSGCVRRRRTFAGTFLNALPSKPELRLDEVSFRDAVCHRFRLPRSASRTLCATVSACPTRIVSTVTSPGALAVRGQTRQPGLPRLRSTSSVVGSAPRGSGLVTYAQWDSSSTPDRLLTRPGNVRRQAARLRRPLPG